MDMLLSFSPFIVYALLSGRTSLLTALGAAAVIAIAMLLRDFFLHHKMPKLLEIGTAVLFGGLAIYVGATHGQWSVPEVRLAVDSGLLAIVLVSMAIRQPFTLQYAREQVPPEVQDSPGFILVNWHISIVWALAFVLMVAADLVMARWPQVPLAVGIVVTVAALVGAVGFTRWYPEWMQRLHAQNGES